MKKSKKRKKRSRERGKSKPIADDTRQLIICIRVAQDLQQMGFLPKGDKGTLGPRAINMLVEHVMGDRFDELYRASKRYGHGLLATAGRTKTAIDATMAYHKLKSENAGKPPDINQLEKEFLRFRPGYLIDKRTLRYIAKKQNLELSRLREVK